MKKSVFFCLLLVAQLAPTGAQNPNCWQGALQFRSAQTIHFFDNSTWIGTSTGLVRLETTSLLPQAEYTAFNSPVTSAVALADDGANLWVGGENLLRFDGTTWTVFDDTNAPLGQNARITALHVDGGQNLWIGTANQGIFRYNGVDWAHFDVNTVPEMPKTAISSIIAGPNGSIIFGFGQFWGVTPEGGLAFLDNTGSWTIAKFSKGNFPIKDVTDLTFDNNGILWASGHEGLAKNTAPDAWEKKYILNDPLNYEYALAITAAPTGELLVGTNNHLYQFDGNTSWTDYPNAIFYTSNNGFTCLAMDPEGRINATDTDNGLLVQSGQALVNIDINMSNFDSYPVTALYTRPGGNTLYAGTAFGGFFAFDGQNWDQKTAIRTATFGKSVSAIDEGADGRVYLGLNSNFEKSILQYTPGAGFDTLFTRQAYGSGSNIRRIFATSHGLYIFSNRHLYQFINDTIEQRTVARLPSNAVWVKDWNDHLWVSAQDSGLYRFDGVDWTDETKNLTTAVSFLTLDPNGKVWGFDVQKNIVQYQTDQWTVIPAANATDRPTFSFLSPNADGSAWIAADSAGQKRTLLFFTGQEFATIADESTAPAAFAKWNKTAAFFQNKLYLGTTVGVIAINQSCLNLSNAPEKARNETLTCSPNPARETVQISWPPGFMPTGWAIRDLSGVLQSTGEIPLGNSSLQLTTSNLPPGLYTVVLTGVHGQKARTIAGKLLIFRGN